MRTQPLCVLLVLSFSIAYGEPGNEPLKPITTHAVRTGAVRMQFTHPGSTDSHQDSIFIIFDRCDRTGAGIVYQLFATDSAHGISIPAIPAGEYFLTIECRGLHRDRVETRITIHAKKNRRLKIRLKAMEIFSKADVFIPAFHPAVRDMAILKYK